MLIIKTISQMQAAALDLKRQGRRIGFVPTMGYLHEGHLSLLDAIKDRCDTLVVSIFVNPAQFSPGEDLDRYPRDFDRDHKLLRERGCDIVFQPAAGEIYPDDYATYVNVDCLTEGLCGKSRPTHFRGVTTIVAKLFNIVQPDIAVFGQKDGQQAAVIKRMARDLNFPVEIAVAPIVREPDGLAMSSRNVYLSRDERCDALCLRKALDIAEHMFDEGQRDTTKILAEIRGFLELVEGADVDYVEAVDPDTMQPVSRIDRPTMFALAVKIGDTRLIDNTIVGGRADS